MSTLSHSVRAGEIIGYRAWEPRGTYLTSMAFHYYWPQKGKPIQAKDLDFFDHYHSINCIKTFQEFYHQEFYHSIPCLNRLCTLDSHTCDEDSEDRNNSCLHTGIHAWKTKELAEKYILEMWSGKGYSVLGTIWMWGEIIEHERGYRSTHAAIRSIDRLVKIKRRGVWADILGIPLRVLKDIKYPNSYDNTLEFYQKEYAP